MFERIATILKIGKHHHSLAGINARPFHGEFAETLPADGIRDTRSGVADADAAWETK